MCRARWPSTRQVPLGDATAAVEAAEDLGSEAPRRQQRRLDRDDPQLVDRARASSSTNTTAPSVHDR